MKDIQNMTSQDFLGLTIDVDTPENWRERILDRGEEAFAYIVTPNVDHIVQLSHRADIVDVYDEAEWRICDSKIVAALARRQGIDLMTYPGADMVRDIFGSGRSEGQRITIIGPSQEDFDILAQRYPQHNLEFVSAPIMTPGQPEWETALQDVEATNPDVTLLCLSFPKQEFFAGDLKKRGVARGTALCVGASVDFLTGRQVRAPQWMRNLGLEWAYRLLSNPRRMWKRYVVDGPKIFLLYQKSKR